MPSNATLYLPTPDPDLRKVFPQARSDKGLFRKATWYEIDVGGAVARFTLMPAAQVAQHLQGFRGFVASRADAREARDEATRRIAATRSVLGLMTQADFDDNEALRRTLPAIAEAFGGFWFTDNRVVLPDGRTLVGGAAPQPVHHDDDDDDDDEPVPPTPRRVAQRALAMCAITCRAFIESGKDDAKAQGVHAQLVPWLRELGLESELEPDEAALLAAPLGTLTPRQVIDASWLSEGLVVLAWALQRHPLPPYDESVHPPEVVHALGFRDPDAARALLSAPALRSPGELAAYTASVLALHWRLRDFGLNGKSMDFAEFVRNARWGPLSLEGLRLERGDLALGADPIGAAPAAQVRHCQSIAQERHRAANWLMGNGPAYSEVDTST